VNGQNRVGEGGTRKGIDDSAEEVPAEDGGRYATLPGTAGRVICSLSSGPLLDRIDIHIEVPAVKYKELRAPSSSEDSAAVRGRVIAARNRQIERFKGEKKMYCNAQMSPKLLRKHCAITADGEKLLANAVTRLGLSARAHDRILKVARTIADLEAAPGIEAKHLSEAIQYRTLDRSYWS
jgi:magnesium chelatase family protein